MASPSKSPDLDVEAQLDVLKPHQPGEDDSHGTTNRPSEVASDAIRGPADPAQPVASASEAKGGEGVAHENEKVIQPERGDTKQAPTPAEPGDVQPGADTQTPRVEDPNIGGPVHKDSGQDPHMIGDFHGSANALWSLYGTEAKSYDDARVKPLKQDMDGVLIFAGLFATALTSFVIDSKQSLQVDPTDQVVYYLQQHSTILSQISQQIASIAPEVSIPSTPPPPFPPFRPLASDIRINTIWFMALAFSLSAALLAILVQQWVRNCMHVFQRYSDPQKSARLRQFLYDGLERWHMPIAAEAVPGLLHISLFLFFAGLADSTMNVSTTIGVATTVPIGICGLLYIFITFAPVIYSQSPYQTSFSGVIWYAVQKLRDRRSKDLDGESGSVSTNMAQGQMQLSMEETADRKDRDKRAIRWLLDNMTEDAEMESFVMAIPGSLKGLGVWAEWSKEELETTLVAQPSSCWRAARNVLGLISHQLTTFTRTRSLTVPSHHSNDSIVNRPELHSPIIHRPIATTSNHERNTIRELCRRIGHLSETCKHRAVFASDELWRRRSRACAEAMASLILYANAEAGWFGDALQALDDIDSFEGVRNLSLAEREESFIVRWTCLSIMTIRPTIKGAKRADFYTGEYDAQDNKAREADETLEHRWRTEHELGLSSKISFAAGIIQEFEDGIRDIIHPHSVDLNETFYEVTRRLTHQLPGVNSDLLDSESFLRQSLDLFLDPAQLRSIHCRQPPKKFLDYIKRIDSYRVSSPDSEDEKKQVIENVFWPKHLLQRTLWSLDDFNEGGLGFAVEVFLLSFRQTYWLTESSDSLYISTFRAITSDRKRYGASNLSATLNIVLDAAISEQGLLRTSYYPDFITDEVWELLGDMLEGHSGPHIDSAVQRFTNLKLEDDGRYEERASALISRLHASDSRSGKSNTPTDLESE